MNEPTVTYLPAVREQLPETFFRADTDSWIAVAVAVSKLAAEIAETELVPEALYGKPAAVTAVILYGREVGLPPMTALRNSHIINGRVGIAAEIMRALVLAAGHDFRFRDATGSTCTAMGRRKGTTDWSEVTWNLDMARAAGVANKAIWQHYPRAMLKARATAELCRDLFPDVIGGFEALEELEDTGAAPPEEQAPQRKLRRAAPRPEPAAEPPRPGLASSSGGVPLEPPHPSSPTDAEPPLAEAGSRVAGAGEVPLPGEDGYDEIGESAPEPVQEPVQQPVQRDTSSWRLTDRQRTKMHTVFGELEVNDRDLRLRLSSLIVGRDLASSNDLTRGEAVALIDTLERIAASNVMREAMRQIVMADDPLAALDEVAAQAGFATVIQPTDNPEPEEPPE